jgi:ATP-dependent Clp protease ATP-binding subunit ClpB
MSTCVELDPSLTGSQAKSLEETLRRLVIGQDEAIEQIVNVYQMYLSGLHAPQRPIGSFLFLGPTGTGKTRIVEATAEGLSGQGKVVRVDCAEFQHSHEIAKLVGSPPGYLGHRETHALLSQETLAAGQGSKANLSFVLFDEIEKASDALWNLLLGILDKGILTTGDNRRVNFASSMIFMTSNLGAAEMQAILNPKLGFQATTASGGEARQAQRIVKTSLDAARRKFTPEFWNRLDKVVVFRPLAAEQLRQVLDIELFFVQQRILRGGRADRSFAFALTGPAKDLLLAEGTDSQYGARHLKRAIERLLVQPLSNLIASNQIRPGDWLNVDVSADGKSLRFERVREKLSRAALTQAVQDESPAWAGVPRMAAAAARGRGRSNAKRVQSAADNLPEANLGDN